jgi:shikimate dehydrogenase
MRETIISAKTKICGVIGDPIEHTLSPAMHNALYKHLSLDFVYLAFKVASQDLEKAVAGMRAMNFRGLNVTIPHKVAVIPLLDRMDILADKIGAVNTIVNDDGILTGYNTDAHGFLKALLERDVRPAGKNVLLLGAGGAARAIGFILAEEQANLTILNRKEELSWAKDLAKCISDIYPIKAKSGELTTENLKKAITTTNILVNATSVGMNPKRDETPVPCELLCADMVVFDIVYNPHQTRLLKEAKEAGALTISGLDMLAWQGVLAFEKFTGRKAPFELMREAALKELPHED